MKHYLTFRKYDNRDEAQAVLDLLATHRIPGIISEEHQMLDRNLIGQQFELPYVVKIAPDQFTAAEDALLQAVDVNAITPEADYYLLSFSDEELLDLVKKKDEWGNYDYALALQLLKERGIDISVQDVRMLQQERVQTLGKQHHDSLVWMIVGYLSAFAGGMLGLFIGLFMANFKKTLPDGSRMHAFSPQSRRHGVLMSIIAVVAFVGWIWYGVTNDKYAIEGYFWMISMIPV